MNSNIFSRARRRTAILTAMLIAIVAALGFAAGGFAQAGDAGTVPKHVGAAACAECHPRQTEQWRGSHHALAMQEAKEQTVLGDFSGIRFTHGGVASRFFRRDNRFFVNTDGPDGHLADFEIKFTFGVHPLQQYLIELPGERLQALSIVWDTRPRAEGGQRWYHLYPGERIKAGDPLHWTARSQNWNYMCAACHSTDLRKNYDAAADTFATRWSDINVACEACHGPGSAHVQWGRQAPASHAATPDKGLVKPSSVDANRRWVFAPGDRIAHRTGATAPGGVLDACFACHARRRQIVEPPIPGAAFLDNYAPTLLEAGAYHADGQIDGEVYEYGSFAQSKMHRAGVVCGDCHDPHSLRPKASGNALCAQCHRPDAFDVESHHGHKAGSAGSLCIDCHMPQKTYMGVDRRRDHGFRVPRPDMSVTHGLPNACGRCPTTDPPNGRRKRWRVGAARPGHRRWPRRLSRRPGRKPRKPVACWPRWRRTGPNRPSFGPRRCVRCRHRRRRRRAPVSAPAWMTPMPWFGRPQPRLPRASIHANRPERSAPCCSTPCGWFASKPRERLPACRTPDWRRNIAPRDVPPRMN
ncbi:MAG: hypothetical protein IPF74_04300 [Rhodocyclaceae bacterium]|nr:hypothetical protein [Rhodocyclaceae bacterium]